MASEPFLSFEEKKNNGEDFFCMRYPYETTQLCTLKINEKVFTNTLQIYVKGFVLSLFQISNPYLSR